MSLRLQRLLTSCVVACALVLKSAVPLLAATAAQLQGVPVDRVCSLYGVVTSQSLHAGHQHAHAHHHGASDGSHDSGSHSAADHGKDHCALTAVVAMAVGHVAAPSLAPDGALASPRGWLFDSAVPDSCALWVAQLAHGPPARA